SIVSSSQVRNAAPDSSEEQLAISPTAMPEQANPAVPAMAASSGATLMQWVRTLAIVLRNILVGGNLTALRFIRSPRQMVEYISECLFLYGLFRRTGGLPQRVPWDGLEIQNRGEDEIGIAICMEASQEWFRA